MKEQNPSFAVLEVIPENASVSNTGVHTFHNLCQLVHMGMHFAVIVYSIHTEDEFGLNLSEPFQHPL